MLFSTGISVAAHPIFAAPVDTSARLFTRWFMIASHN
jgi:hypothetical protein